MCVFGWIVICIVGLNLLFFGSLAIIWIINYSKEDCNEKRKTSS